MDKVMRTDIEGRVFIVGVLAELASGKRITHDIYKRFMDTIKSINERENEPKCREWLAKFNELLGCVYGRLDGNEVREMYKNDSFYAVMNIDNGEILCVTNSLDFAEECRDDYNELFWVGICVHDYQTALGLIRRYDKCIRRFY